MKKHTTKKRILQHSLLLGILCLFLQSGCSQFASSSANPTNWFAETEEIEKEIPDRILPIWTDTVLHQPNQRGVRGFGGRIYFYKDGEDTPIEVDGNMTVYVFDGDYDSQNPTQPLKKYVITAAQLQKLESKSTLGMSYSIWIPWEEVGGASKKLNLIARFDGTNGGTVISNSSTKLLPGIDTPKNRMEIQKAKNPSEDYNGIAQVSYLTADESQSPTSPERPSQDSTTIFSIDLPNSLERKINSAAVDTADSEQTKSNQTLQPWSNDALGVTPQMPDSSQGPIKFPKDETEARNGFSTAPNLSGGSAVTTVSSEDPRIQSHSDNMTRGNMTQGNVTRGKVGAQARVIGSRLQSHFGPRRFRARTESTTPQDSSLVRTQPHRATWQIGLPPTPRSNR